RLVRPPAVSWSVPPCPQPLDHRIGGVVVPGGNDRLRRDELMTPVIGGSSIRLLQKHLTNRLDLFGGPQLVRIQLPKETLRRDVRKWRGDHFSFPVPESTAPFPIDRRS